MHSICEEDVARGYYDTAFYMPIATQPQTTQYKLLSSFSTCKTPHRALGHEEK